MDEARQSFIEARERVTEATDPARVMKRVIELGQAELEAKEYNAALNVFDIGLAKFGMSHKLWLNKGVARTEWAVNRGSARGLELALDWFDRALQINPDYPEANRERDRASDLLAGLGQEEKDRAEAVEKARRQIEVNEKALASLTEKITRHQSDFGEKKNAVRQIEVKISDRRNLDKVLLEPKLELSSQLEREIVLAKTELSQVEAELKLLSDEWGQVLKQVRADRLSLPTILTPGVIRIDTRLLIEIAEPHSDASILGIYVLEPSGTVQLGAKYGRVALTGLTFEEAEFAIQQLLFSTLTNPKVMVTLPRGDEAADPTQSRAD